MAAILVGGLIVVVISIGSSQEAAPRRTTKKTLPIANTTTTRGDTKYTVKAGDTLLAISKQFGVSTQAIANANNIVNPDSLVAGQVLTIPPVTPIRLVVKPHTAQTGGDIEILLKGAQPAELITFEIHRPTGSVFVGSVHSATEVGEVDTSYRLGPADVPGDYVVVAKGDQITNAQTTFRVVAAIPTTTSTTRAG